MKFLNQPVKNPVFLTGFFILVALVSGCESQNAASISLAGETMGTTYHITVAEQSSNASQESLKKAIDTALVEVNNSFSTYIESSEVSLLNSSKTTEGQIKSKEFIKVLSEAQRISEITHGAYDITVGPLVNLWGFGPEFKEEDIPSDGEVNKALSKVGYKGVEYNQESKEVKKLTPDLYIDFSSIAKGYGVDVVAGLLDSKGYLNYMVEIGGEMRVRGVNTKGVKWRIAVEKPDSTKRSIHRVIGVTDIAIATSGGYRNFFEKDGVRFSHTINPNSGRPVQHNLASVTVLSKSSMTADAWATAFMVLGDEKGYDLAMKNKLSVLFLVKDGKEIKEMVTPGFQAITEEHSS